MSSQGTVGYWELQLKEAKFSSHCSLSKLLPRFGEKCCQKWDGHDGFSSWKKSAKPLSLSEKSSCLFFGRWDSGRGMALLEISFIYQMYLYIFVFTAVDSWKVYLLWNWGIVALKINSSLATCSSMNQEPERVGAASGLRHSGFCGIPTEGFWTSCWQKPVVLCWNKTEISW